MMGSLIHAHAHGKIFISKIWGCCWIIIIIRGKWCPAFSFYVYHLLHRLPFIPNLVPLPLLLVLLLLVPLHGVESGMIHLVSQWWKITGKLLSSVTLDLMCFFYSMTSPTSNFSGVRRGGRRVLLRFGHLHIIKLALMFVSNLWVHFMILKRNLKNKQTMTSHCLFRWGPVG